MLYSCFLRKCFYSQISVLALIAGSSAAPAATAAPHCPVNVRPASDATVAYGDRGDRCEGLYQQPVSASARLQIIGVHRNPPQFGAVSAGPIVVSAPGAPGKDLKLRILSTRPQHYYRLDASLGAAARFTWKRDIIDHVRVGLKPAEVAALLCEGACEKPVPLIYPVSIAEGTAQQVAGITVRMRAALDLKSLLVTVTSNGAPLPHLNNQNILDRSTLPGGVAKSLFLDLGAGTYELRAMAIPIGSNAPDEVRATIVLK